MLKNILYYFKGDVKPQPKPARDAVLWNVPSGWKVVA